MRKNTSTHESKDQEKASASISARKISLLLLLPLGTLILQSTVFLGMNASSIRAIDWWPVSFVGLVPWVVFLVITPHRRLAYLASYALGVSFYLVNTSYIWRITEPGYFALAGYFGLSYLLFALALRPAYLRWKLPLTFAVPVLWVAGEFARGIGPLAFPFLFLSHGVFRNLVLIQISDVIGAYGVSFVIAIINGFLAACVMRWLRRADPHAQGKSLFGSLLAAVLILSATLLYGVIQLNRHTMRDGPRIATLQGDYPLSTELGQFGPSNHEKAKVYLEMADRAAGTDPLDLILLPETPWTMSLNDEFLSAETLPVAIPYYEILQKTSRVYDQWFHEIADRHNAYVVVGASSIEFPSSHYPKTLKYNSAFAFAPNTSSKSRYDKVALVMFGEYTPFRYGRLHALYRWLDGFNPFSSPDDEFSLTAGTNFSVFEMSDSQGRTFHFGVPICFEDLIPKISRTFARGSNQRAPVDFLLSISNDGWFNHGSMVPQHLAVCVFRAVENRLGIARSVNTACSGFVDPDGRIHHLVNKNGRYLGRGIFGYQVANIKIDSRRSLYTRFGDWFGTLCTVAGAAILLLTRIWTSPPRV